MLYSWCCCIAQMTVKTLLLVKSTVRAAVQRSRAYCQVDDECQTLLQQPTGVVMFAGWLGKHSGLVNSLALCPETGQDTSLTRASMLLGLQLCAEQAAQLAAGQPLSPSGSPYPPPLRLKNFTTTYMLAPALLTLLPLFGVQEMYLADIPQALLTANACQC